MNTQEPSASADKAWAEQLLAMPASDYMNDEQLAFFRRRLLDERAEIEAHLKEMKDVIASHERDSDESDQASFEEELRLALRQADRESRLLNNIESALKRIENGEYGYCEETGDPIGLPRLMFRPTAKLCIEAKERQEQQEHHYRKARWE
ncbi:MULTISPECIES: RNA polymerase-binding protein DksA [unclassified Halomonas]|uniref:RNA polymerase-binding protein DksA n=1 Tax=unclassified Halomonas TaxID=2609666 RepID=UPI0007DA26C4|nr:MULTISPECIES: RNA polymerase-binding protein DksA [unclassified Halomonas]MBT2786367.1 RNA polymerase-binding protein DksA [Halomonas sp. ISL-106]MBT2797389.1 RNA polymerase-binding protein DksA [Halomonas sp. ISL-104]OAL58756.1 RNA polymerase-binding protein DksA [Halomonas sp. ALS9]